MNQLVDAFLFFLRSYGALLAILDPLGNIVIFLGLVDGLPQRNVSSILNRSIITSLLLLLIFSLLGKYIFFLFHVTLISFRIAGFILLLLVAYDMLQGEYSRVKLSVTERVKVREEGDIAIFPLAFPMISGPGALTLAVVLMGEVNTFLRLIALLVAIFSAIFTVYLILRKSSHLAKRFGRTGLMVVKRLMGLLLAAMAVQFVLEGIEELLR